MLTRCCNIFVNMDYIFLNLNVVVFDFTIYFFRHSSSLDCEEPSYQRVLFAVMLPDFNSYNGDVDHTPLKNEFDFFFAGAKESQNRNQR